MSAGIGSGVDMPPDPDLYRGDCFVVAFTLAVDLAAEFIDTDLDVYVAHGIPTGTGGEAGGLRYWHAWVEVDDPDGEYPTVVDLSNGGAHRLPTVAYYRVGSIADVWRFTPDEAIDAAVEWGHYGPWVDGWEDMTDA